MLAYLAVPTKLLPPLTAICCPVFRSLYFFASPKSMIYTVLAFSPRPIVKLFALMSRCTKPFLCICSSRVMIWIPMVRTVDKGNFLPLNLTIFTKVGRGLKETCQEVRWSWRCDHDLYRYHSRIIWICQLVEGLGTDALEELIELDLIEKLSVSFAFLFLDEDICTTLAA